MKVTLSVLKADVGSIGGHTKPAQKMLSMAEGMIEQAIGKGQLLDGMVTFTGDDMALVMSHKQGGDAKDIHAFGWNCFEAATAVAKDAGLYGAGQDLLTDAPSGTIRGAGPAVAEIEFELDPESKDRPAEAFLVFAADKCGPGAYNYPLYGVFCDPMQNGGILLNPKVNRGFVLTIIDMDSKGGDRVIELSVPERVWDVAALLHDSDRFGIEKVHSRFSPDEQVASVSATRLHNVAGKYVGKDDPVAIVRTQGIFCAPEEVVMPWTLGHFVTGGARGSHVMPIMPVSIGTPLAGAYCLPVVSCLAFSMSPAGKFTEEYVDMFDNPAWDATRLKIQQKADEWRRQGFVGPTMASQAELSYTGIVEIVTRLDKEFAIR